MRTISLALVLALAAASPAAAATPLINGKSPDSVAQHFRTLGYQVGDVEKLGDYVRFEITRNASTDVVGLGSCTSNANCKYLLLTGVYTDVPEAPAKWLNDLNETYDLVTVSNSEQGLRLRVGAMLGEEGIPASTFATILEQWHAANEEIAEAAIKAKIVKE